MLDDLRWDYDPRDRRDDDRRDRRDRGDENVFTLGRGPGSAAVPNEQAQNEWRTREGDARGLERDRESRDREHVVDPRDVFARHVDLTRGQDRELVYDLRGREYTLRGSESRTLAAVGAFRVVSVRDVRDHDGRSGDPRAGDLRHLREEGLVRIERLDGHRDPLVVLTKEGSELLESRRHHHSHAYHHSDQRDDHQQEFYAGLKKPREAEHDSQIYRAYLREAERLTERGARIDRIVLDYELKHDYQCWLHERDRDREDAFGKPDRDANEIELWARDHGLPYFDERVHFPDVRIEYEERDGCWDHRDVEVVTVHYRGAHGAAAGRSGFARYAGSSARIGGGRRGVKSRFAEEFLD